MLSCQKLSFRPRAGNARAPHGCDTLEIVSWTANTPTSPRLSLRVAIAALGRCNCFVELHDLASCLISTPSTASHVMSGTLRRAGPSSSRNCMPELRQPEADHPGYHNSVWIFPFRWRTAWLPQGRKHKALFRRGTLFLRCPFAAFGTSLLKYELWAVAHAQH